MTAKAQEVALDRVLVDRFKSGDESAFNEMVADAETDALYLHLAREMSRLGLVYIHIVDHSAMGAPPVSASLKAELRAT